MHENHDRRDGHERRENEWSHNDIMQAVIENSTRITAVEKKLDNMAMPHDWEETLRDVAAVGRTGRLITRFTKWFAPIAAAVGAFFHYITNYQPPSPPP